MYILVYIKFMDQLKMEKDDLLIKPIMYSIMHEVSRAGAEPERLSGEPVLCQRFGVARGTVRRAMSRLMEQGYVIQLPKRRGYFSNPKFSRFGELNIGILVGAGHITAMACTSSDAFAGFMQGIRPLTCTYYFLSLNSCGSREAAGLAEAYGLDALFWISPEDGNMSAIDELTDAGFPVAATENIYIPNRVHPKSNFLAFDFRNSGVLRAREILDAGFRKPVYCAKSDNTTDAFAEFLRSRGVPFDKKSVVGLEEISSVIPRRLKRNGLDCIICNGNGRRYNRMFETLSRLPGGKQVPLFLEREVNSLAIQEKYPDFNIRFFEGLDARASETRAGRRAGALIRQMLLKKRKNSFESELFQ